MNAISELIPTENRTEGLDWIRETVRQRIEDGTIDDMIEDLVLSKMTTREIVIYLEEIGERPFKSDLMKELLNRHPEIKNHYDGLS